MSALSEKILARINKALALAKGQSGTPEGETAAKIAQEMMDEHAVSMADLDTASREKADPLTTERVDIGSQDMWRRSLMGIVARHCTLRTVYTSGTTKMRLFGHEADIAVCEYLFEIIARQVQQGADKYMRSLKGVTAGEARAAHNAFCCSAVSGVSDKLAAIRAARLAPQEAGTGMTLRSREDRMLAYFDATKGNTTTGGGMSGRHSSDGYSAGKNVSINAGVGAPAGFRQLGGS